MRVVVALIFGAALGLVSLGTAQAAHYGMAGCGLGSIVMGPRGGQLSAATTNGTMGSQTFGITSGTSNCTPDSKTAAVMQQQQFMVTNYSTLSKEAAQGAGNTLTAWSASLGCSADVQSEFNGTIQRSHGSIFAAPGAVATLDATKETLKQNPTLASACAGLI